MLIEYPGEDPLSVLMNGFPDTLHLYDHLLPWLSPTRRVVTFDFLGWGESDKPVGYPYTAANQVGDLDADREEFLPLLYQRFAATPSAQPAFFRLNEDLLFTVRDRTKRISQMNAFRRPLRIIFGASDPYLNVGVARRFHELFPTSELFLLPSAHHYVQIDEPEQRRHRDYLTEAVRNRL